ncbi:DUF7257 domain-containing protein [Mycobacterium palustre]|uniref:Minor tail protein n=1 Tax=Mycobacterium palustre TaxID=153971 RepID=A0A1X1ZKY3_9MYCO|nr:phage tail domain-containing protein [Mycobacterium palustre]MCV7100973.1 phage tail family protein [Mycobacterium palustre]ORW24013.1 hypothetical protein AWC19_00200 [Mycobacterium palustre]
MSAPIRYPAGPITKHGAYYVLNGMHPEVTLTAYDKSIQIAMMGGKAIPNRTMPEYVILKDIDGLIPPWQMIDQKGATQDGVTFLDALYDPMEVNATVIVRGRDAKHTRKVIRDLVSSIDAKQVSELSWYTQELGYWWAPIRWFKTPPDKLAGAQQRRQQLTLRLRADNGFWRTFDDIDQFKLNYEANTDSFGYVTDNGLGDGWTVGYSGRGPLVRCDGQQVLFIIDPARPVIGDTGRDAVFRRNDFTTSTNNQFIEITLGVTNAWTFPDGAYDDIWGRLNNTGIPGLYGVRARIGLKTVRLSYFVNGAETILREQPLSIQAMSGEKFALVCGYDGNSRMFKVLRNGSDVPGMTVVEHGSGSPLGSSYRSVGFGLHAAPSTGLTPALPLSVRRCAAGTHATTSQSGFVTRINVGDQRRYERYTCFGPGTFSIADGPGSTDFVQFGPLLANQVMQIRTLDNSVVNLTSTPASPQEQAEYEQALSDLASFATANNAPQVLGANRSIFGVQAPQGNPYSLLHGRFRNPVPPKSPGAPAQKQHIAVKIDGGNVDSAILATGTPLRRYPA